MRFQCLLTISVTKLASPPISSKSGTRNLDDTEVSLFTTVLKPGCFYNYKVKIVNNISIILKLFKILY